MVSRWLLGGRRPSVRIALVVIVGVGGLSLGASTAHALSTVAALGDSITRGWGSGGNAADNVSASWATGTNQSVQSHYTRLLAAHPALTALNLAKSGSKMAATMSQADAAVSAGAGYVTVLSGTNDVCTATAGEMTAVSTFSSKIRNTLTKLSAIPDVEVLVASVPDWYGLWTDFKDDPSATSAWASRNVCPTIFGVDTSATDREAARQRIVRYNDMLASVCADFPACTFDNRTVHGLRFTRSELAFDYFHPSIEGQARLAAALWAVGPFEAAPPPPPPPPANLAPNPGFEQSPSLTYNTSGGATFSWATDAARSPTHSVKIASSVTTMTRWLTKKTLIKAEPGRTYDASVWVKTAGVTGSAKLMLTFWNAAGTYLGVTAQSSGTSGTRDWTQLTVARAAPPNSAYVRIELRQSGTGTSWWDDVSLLSP